ncbi:MAG: hypothetical protein IM486_00660 [Microcystis sp. M114S2]|jgi:hypothetical protein|nr:hypothetical protein [Microcystis aeruginosa]MCA2666893.1 hypothetical protein [Microcystis sp. M045S2]MCA2714127.1 hypothetical protein [Microcystis sp. M172S2]MCA2802663.1 hypothetical protein [Microcystis sp. M114S2]MCA2832857.1 hypothetical protein [Microcystis sp. M007S1]MCA2840017.1 hypothetical protein [Microcystis sp. M078S1]MCA2843327.1 hypothetical protein [Microcystis sp. M079S1]MCA2849049.1 hypothetical protein [Microcystis sp. M074S1]NCR78311.1 hypothetical protein [Microcys
MLNGINFMLSSLIIELEQKLRDCSLEDKKWLLEQLHQQLGLNNQQTTKQRLIDSWNDAYSDGLDESETLMLERIRHHQRQLSE